MNRLCTFTTFTAALVALQLSACGKGDISRSTQVLAQVGDKEITTTYFDRQVGNLPESVQKFSNHGEGKKAILEALVNRELLYAAAIDKKIDKTADMQKKLEDLKKELIVNTYLQSQILGKITVDDKEAEKFYNSNPAEFRNREEVRISQIVVPDTDKAAVIHKKLSIRREFGDLARTHSTDKASAARKGDVGWFTHNKLPENVRDSIFKLKIGEVSKPFKIGESYEVYCITDRRTVSYTFDQVKEAIKVQLFNEKTQEALKTLVEELKKTAKVQVNEALLK